MVQSSCDYITINLAEPLDIGILAARLNYAKYYLSRSYFTTAFTRERGMPPQNSARPCAGIDTLQKSLRIAAAVFCMKGVSAPLIVSFSASRNVITKRP